MLTYIRNGLIFIVLVTLLTACGRLSDKEEQEYYQKAIPIGQDYFRKYYDAEVEFTEFYINVPMSSTMVLKGPLNRILILKFHYITTSHLSKLSQKVDLKIS